MLPKSKMSDYICLEILEEIIIRLPVKSLIRFRSVSKPWKSLIDSSEFIAAYTHRHAQSQHLLIRYRHRVEIKEQYVCFVDDHTFPDQKFAPTLPSLVQRLHDSSIVGSSHGLLCMYGHYSFPGKKEMIVLWNPSIRKSVAVALPDVNDGTVFGFGVCPVTLDPKIVKITHKSSWDKTSIPWQAEVYALGSGVWRSLSTNLSSQSTEVGWDQVVVNRFIYWSAWDRIDTNDGFRVFSKIISFDMITNEFREIHLPNCLALRSHSWLSVSKVWESESLAVLEMEYKKRRFSIWMMDHNTPNSFTKLFMINTSLALIPQPQFTRGWHLGLPLGFRRSGEPVLDYFHADCFGQVGLVVYEPHSQHVTDLGIRGAYHTICVNSYTESLLLLDQPATFQGTP